MLIDGWVNGFILAILNCFVNSFLGWLKRPLLPLYFMGLIVIFPLKTMGNLG